MAKNMRTAKYVDSKGNEFKIWVEDSRLDESGNTTKVGYAAADANTPSMPHGARPRAVQVKDDDGNVRWVTCYTTAATLWTGSATAITMNPFAGSESEAVEFTATGVSREEKFRRKATDTYTS